MAGDHRREVCRHGTLVTQCRCIGPKHEVTVPCPEHCERRREEDER